MPTQCKMEDDYTLLAVNTLSSGGTISRFFNFASQQVTTIFREKAEVSGEMRAYSSEGGVSVARAVALTSQMQVQKFSELDSTTELELMHEKLVQEGGHPPALPGTLDKSKHSVAKLG